MIVDIFGSASGWRYLVPLDDILQPVVGFAFHVTNGRLFNITNITDARALASPHKTDFHANRNLQIFQLMDGEHVTKLNYVNNKSYRVLRVCIETNLRKSEWFGARGAGSERTIDVPEGHFCAGLTCSTTGPRGSRSNEVDLMGLLVWPVEEEEQCDEPVQYSHEDIGTETLNATGTPFRNKADDLRAVLIEADTRVSSMAVIPNLSFKRYRSLNGYVDMGSSQHIFEMVPDEKIIGIDYGMGSSDVVAAVRLRTTHRVSQWFGGSVSGEVTWLRCPHPEEQSVCGFFGTKTEGGVHSLGIIVAAPMDSISFERTDSDISSLDYDICSGVEE